MDGKNTFHATQMPAWQRGPARDVIFDDLKPSTMQVLHVPEAMEILSEINIPSGEIGPLFSKPIEKKWFEAHESNAASLKNAKAADMAFGFQQQSCTKRTGSTEFNQRESTSSPEIKTVGYMSVIQAAAHEIDTCREMNVC